MENTMVGNATEVSFVLLVTLVVIIPCFKTGIGKFDNFLKAQSEEAYKIALDTCVPTHEDVTNELNLHHNYKKKGMVGLIVVSNSGDVAYGLNYNGMSKGYATEDGFTEVKIWD
ncbi:putative isoaspartyl peptidase/L-asparaginase 2, partial [Mucuna pruriens]